MVSQQKTVYTLTVGRMYEGFSSPLIQLEQSFSTKKEALKEFHWWTKHLARKDGHNRFALTKGDRLICSDVS